MRTYDLGDGVELEHRVYRDGILVDPVGAVTFIASGPDRVSVTVPVERVSTGVYRVSMTASAAGSWAGVWHVPDPLDMVPVAWFVALPVARQYATLVQLKHLRNIPPEDTANDPDLLDDIEAASRRVDNRCSRHFWLPTVAYVKRIGHLGWTDCGAMIVPDVGALDGLQVQAWDGTWQDLTEDAVYPGGALAEGKPVTGLYLEDQAMYAGQYRKVRARWGWPTVPAEVRKATLLLASRHYLRRNSPEGVIRSADFGDTRVSRWDPDVEALLSPLALPNPA